MHREVTVAGFLLNKQVCPEEEQTSRRKNRQAGGRINLEKRNREERNREIEKRKGKEKE